MSCTSSTDFDKCQIERYRQQLIAMSDAIIALSSGVEEYMLDTGQSRQRVKRFDIQRLKATYDGIYNQLKVLEARVYGCGGITMRPAW